MSIQKRIGKLETSVLRDREMIVKLEELSPLYQSLGKEEHVFISKKILEKIISLKEQLIKDPSNLLLNYSTMRYTLETLIHCRLLVKEDSYIYKLYYSVYLHQINKAENFLNRLKSEIELIAKYEKMEAEKSVVPNFKGKATQDEIQNFFEKNKEIEAEIDQLADKELTVFFGDFKRNGYLFQKSIMENELTKIYEDKLIELNDLKDKRARQILVDKRINTLFDFKQASGVFKELKEQRSWNKKADDTDLAQEYKLVYEISSALLHSTSYSIITPIETLEQEQFFALDMTCQYSNAIYDCLNVFLEYQKISKIKVVNLKS